MNNKCLGFAGWLFGHKFIKSPIMIDEVLERNHCWRCGMPRGGWE